MGALLLGRILLVLWPWVVLVRSYWIREMSSVSGEGGGVVYDNDKRRYSLGLSLSLSLLGIYPGYISLVESEWCGGCVGGGSGRVLLW